MALAVPGARARRVAGGKGLHASIAVAVAIPSELARLPRARRSRRLAPRQPRRVPRPLGGGRSGSSSASSTTRRSRTSSRRRRSSRATSACTTRASRSRSSASAADVGVLRRRTAGVVHRHARRASTGSSRRDDRQGPRRFLATKAEDLPKLNQLYRERSQPRRNLPVVDGALEPDSPRSRRASRPARRTRTRSTRSSSTSRRAAAQARREHGGQARGARLRHHRPGGPPDRLRRPGPRSTGCGPTTRCSPRSRPSGRLHPHRRLPPPPQRRSQADGRQVSVRLWLKDDLLVDDYEFGSSRTSRRARTRSTSGSSSGDTRLKVKSGPQDGENRIDGGPIRVQ